MKLTVDVLEEAGYESALKGLALSYKQDKDMSKVAKNLSDRDGGHNKFLEQIQVWLMVRAPRFWWQEADTYRLSSKSSESTMHTLIKEIVKADDLMYFGMENFNYPPSMEQLREIRTFAKAGDLATAKSVLPEGFLQRRMWLVSYKTLRNIIMQRRNHRLPHWQQFIADLLDQLEHPELLPF